MAHPKASDPLGLLRNVEDLHDPALHLALAVTPGHRDFRDILFNHEARAEKRPDPGSAVARVEWITWLLIGIELAGLLLSWVSFCLQWGAP